MIFPRLLAAEGGANVSHMELWVRQVKLTPGPAGR